MRKPRIAILGATGVVGREITKITEELNVEFESIRFLSSARSAGSKITFKGKEYTVEEAVPEIFDNIDIVMASAGGSTSQKFAPEIVKRGGVIIDNSSAFRMEKDVPLVIAGVNDEDLRKHKGIIANPNCSTSQLMLVLEPLKKFDITRLIVSTYQAVSGAGLAAINELRDDTIANLEGKSFENVIREAKCMIGPVVFSKNGEITGSSSNKKMSVETLFQEMTKEQILFGGCINEEIRHECEQKEIKAFDFMKMDDVAIYNAIATAEGAIMEAIKMQPINLHKSRCLVLGYGRCAKVLAAKLKGMDAQVTVCARNKTARSLAKSFGLEVMDFTELKRRICQYDHIFNTVPKQILKEDILRKISKESCIIDIASYPGGTNHQMAEKLGICAKLCPSLPGIYSPKSSGIMLAKKVLEISGEIKHGIEK